MRRGCSIAGNDHMAPDEDLAETAAIEGREARP